MSSQDNFDFRTLEGGSNKFSPSCVLGSPESELLFSPSSINSISFAENEDSNPLCEYPELENFVNLLPIGNMCKEPHPELVIVEQPSEVFRFRYISEMTGSHGCLNGRAGKRSYPTVKLNNYSGSAIIVCSLVQADSDDPHPHKLVTARDLAVQKTEEFVQIPVGQHLGYEASFSGLLILITAKKTIKERKNSYGHINLEDYGKEVNGNSVRMKFQCYDEMTRLEICSPVYSSVVDNSKSAETAPLKIVNASRGAGSCHGGDKVMIFVEKVNKKNIEILFFELGEGMRRTWQAKATFGELDVHHQYGIDFRTPPYRNPDIDHDVQVYFELHRPKDGAKSNSIQFVYKAQLYRNKRRRPDENYHSANLITANVPSERIEQNIPLEENSNGGDNIAGLESIMCNELMRFEDIDWRPYLGTDSEMDQDLNNKRIVIDSPAKPNNDAIKKLLEKITDCYSDDDVQQFVKLIRSLHIWRNKKSDRNAENLENALQGSLSNGDNVLLLLIHINSFKPLEESFTFLKDNKSPSPINRVNHRGQSLLHWAVVKNRPKIVALLLKNGSDPNIRDSDGNTPLHYSIFERHRECLRNILDYNENKFVFGYALKTDIYNDEGLAPIHIAVMKGDRSIMEQLVNAGASVDKKTVTDNKSVLHMCAENGRLDVLKYVLELEKIDVNDYTSKGYTALDYACSYDGEEAPEMCKNLLENGANPSMQISEKSTVNRVLGRGKNEIIDVFKEHLPANYEEDMDFEENISDVCSELADRFESVSHYSSEQSDESDYQSIINDDDDFDDEWDNFTKKLDSSGKWREFAVQQKVDYLIIAAEDCLNPAGLIVSALRLERKQTVQDAVDALKRLQNIPQDALS